MSNVEIRSVTKRFGPLHALKDITLTFEENKMYGLLGRNGAGKSTLLNIMTNRLRSTEGNVYIDGQPVYENDETLTKIYCMSEYTLFPDYMTVRNVKSLSTGYSSILKIITARATHVPVLLLDEPVLGLDANHRDLFYRELIANYSEQRESPSASVKRCRWAFSMLMSY
ncbi:ATP-binding cassette domain-containing protein [Bacillus sp. 1P06AnD]|uniref:ATP-binding cassette domain-containing protein n=1 Tax=Bacillus sp. 1P06AnD TaxID=3132208 RepID=UPI0039A098BF